MSSLCYSLSRFSDIAAFYFLALLVSAAVSDFRERSIPEHMAHTCFFFAVAGSFDPDPGFFLMRVIGAVFCFLLLFSVYLLSHGRGFGGADVKIISLSVLVLGFFDTAEALLWGCCLGLFFEIVRPRLPNIKSDGIPVITFFVLGVILQYIFT